MLLLVLLLTAVPAAASTISWPDVAAPLPVSRDGGGDAAVIVGVERYGSVPPVPGATDNAKDWYAYLTRVRGVPTASTRLLLDNEGTREKLRKYAVEAAGRVRPGGTLWFVFIGHGAPAPDGKDGILVGFDAQQDPDMLYDRSLPREELLGLLGKGKQARTVVLLDACFSGRTASGAALAPGLQPLLPVAARVPVSATVLSAGRADQFAGPLPGSTRPAFSFLVLGALRGWGDGNGDGNVSAQEAVDYAGDALRSLQNERTQTPEVAGPGADRALATGGKERGPDLAALVLERRGGRMAPTLPAPAAPVAVPAPPAVTSPATPATTSPAAPAAAGTPGTGTVQRFVLANGLVVLVDELPGAKSVGLSVLHRAGAAADPPGQAGRAHLVEHLMFQGAGPDGKSVVDTLTSLGGKGWNGYTGEDSLRLLEQLPAASLEAILKLEASRLGGQHERIDEKTFRAQLEVVENECRQAQAGGHAAVTELLYPPGHPYRAGIMGSARSRAAITHPAILAALQRLYSPANAVLAISGDVKAGEVRKLVERLFGPLAPGSRLPPVTPVRVGLASSQTLTFELPGNDPPAVELFWPGAPAGTTDDAVLDVAASWLSATGGPLAKRVREELGLTYGVEVSNSSSLLGSRFAVEARTQPENLEKLVAELDRALATARPTAADIESARARLLERLEGETQTPLGRSRWLAGAELTGEPVDPARWFARWEKVTAPDVQRVLERYVAGKPRVALRKIRKADAPAEGRVVR